MTTIFFAPEQEVLNRAGYLTIGAVGGQDALPFDSVCGAFELVADSAHAARSVCPRVPVGGERERRGEEEGAAQRQLRDAI